MARILVVVVVALAAAAWGPVGAWAAPAKINGTGSSYVAVAMGQWVSDAQTRGLSVNYLPTGSPQGLTSFEQKLIDFAGTEAEYSALGVGGGPERGYQYVPDVAGAVAIMYNVYDKADRKVDSLHLSRRTIARIFMGDIARWSDPAISADNRGLQLPDQPITVVYRSGQSGTTALFYDFVANTVPDLFAAWAAKYRLPTNVRIIQLDGTPNFAPKTAGYAGSDQIAQSVGSTNGKWSIAYDEFAFAKTYNVPAAWVDNEAGKWVLPYAENISAALDSARLRPDLSQELAGVYKSTNPAAYPISAYSYMVTQCAVAADRATCKGAYSNAGVTETLSKWMSYIACEGQVPMARIGYSPLPSNLSQELMNSVGRLDGKPPLQLSASNCANPRFHGSLGAGATSPADPYVGAANLGGGNTGATGGGGGGSGAGTANGGTTGGGGGGTGGGNQAAGGSPGASPAGNSSGGTGAGVIAGAGTAAGTAALTGGGGAQSPDAAGGAGVAAPGAAAVGVAGAAAPAVGGGAGRWRAAAPVVYDRPVGAPTTIRPVVLLLAFLAMPPLFDALRRLKARPGRTPVRARH